MYLTGHTVHMGPRQISQRHLLLHELRVVLLVQRVGAVHHRHDVAMRQFDAFGLAGGAGRVDNRRNVVGGDVGEGRYGLHGDRFAHPAEVMTWGREKTRDNIDRVNNIDITLPVRYICVKVELEGTVIDIVPSNSRNKRQALQNTTMLLL